MSNTLDRLLNGKQIVAVVCNQLGDSGKGKISDYFSEWADVIARGTGGANAGHTTVVNGIKRIFHLIPAGIVYDSAGKVNILGNGMVIDLGVLCGEFDALEKDGGSYKNLMISKDANLVLPLHLEIDQGNKSQKSGGIGTTGRGIGPAYTDKIARRGVTINDLYDKDTLAAKLKKLYENFEEQRVGNVTKEILKTKPVNIRRLQEIFIKSENGELSVNRLVDLTYEYIPNLIELYQESNSQRINIASKVEETIEYLKPYAERIKPFVRDTIGEMHTFRGKGKKILLEGAQGLLLSIEFGTNPYVTSSDCSINGTATGVGLPANAIDLPLGVVKFPFMTRVGGGPFPTEIGGKLSEDYCAEDEGRAHTLEKELLKYNIPCKLTDRGISYDHYHKIIIGLMNSKDALTQGIGLRLAADEFGATTGRPRRTGWIDAVAGKYAVGVNGPLMVLTKVDAVAGVDEFKICEDYEIKGNRVGFEKDCSFLKQVSPIYSTFKGYSNITGEQYYDELPSSLIKGIERFENLTGGHALIISTGAERSHTIVR